MQLSLRLTTDDAIREATKIDKSKPPVHYVRIYIGEGPREHYACAMVIGIESKPHIHWITDAPIISMNDLGLEHVQWYKALVGFKPAIHRFVYRELRKWLRQGSK